MDSFQRLIKPQVYNWIHDSIHEVIHVDYKDLADGVPFQQAVREFLKWCGEEYVFCTWGIYRMVWRRILFAIRYEENGERRALEFAADKMGVEKKNGVPSGTGRCVLYCMYFAKNRR